MAELSLLYIILWTHSNDEIDICKLSMGLKKLQVGKLMSML